MAVTAGSGIYEMAVTELDQASMVVDSSATQPVTESVRKKRNKNDVTKEIMSFCAGDAAKKAAREMMEAMVGDSDMREKRMTDHPDGVLKKSLSDAVKEMGESLTGRVTLWESKMQQQLVDFEKKWEYKIVQVEPGSVEGTISAAEHRVLVSVQTV